MESFLVSVMDSWIYTIECLFDAVFTLGKTEILVIFSVKFFYQKKYSVLKNLTMYYWGMLLFLFLPLVGFFINKFTFDFEGYYTGFYNLLPTNYLIAATITYVFFNILSEVKWKLYAKRGLFLLVAIIIIFLLGRSNYYLATEEKGYDYNVADLQLLSSDDSDAEMSDLHNAKVENKQKVPDEVVSVVNIIRADSERPIIAAPFEYCIYIRQFSPECKLAFGRYDSFWTKEMIKGYEAGDITVIKKLLKECKKKRADYIVFPLTSEGTYDEVISLFQDKGWNVYTIDENRLIVKKDWK